MEPMSEDEMEFFDKVAAGIGIGAATLMAILLSIHLIINMLGG
jgi:sporulation-control protein spo0M